MKPLIFSEDKNIIEPTQSVAVPSLFIGIFNLVFSSFSSDEYCSWNFVFMVPGEMALILTLKGDSSETKDLVIPETKALEAA